MHLLKRLWTAVGVRLPTRGNPPGPPAETIAIGPDGNSPIHRIMDEYRLPWREPRQSVERRIGVSTDPIYGRETLFFPDAVQPPGALQPWHAAMFERYAPDMPVVRFSALAWFIGNAGSTIQRIADHYADRLGPAPVGQQYNTLACRWQSGTASLQLQSWPPAWQPPDLKNDACAREPRLATACHLTLLTGYRLPLTVEEEQWVSSSRTISTTRPFIRPEAGGILNTAPSDTEVEYARDPGGYLDAVQNRIGCPPGREALILCTHQLFVLAARDVVGFDVIRLLPAKGSGGSTLTVRCRTTCSGIAYKTLHVAQHDDPDGVTELGRELAKLFDTLCEVGPYFPDT